MSKINRRESLQSLASYLMLGCSAGTAAYIKRNELSDLFPERRPEWSGFVMILTSIHPEGISRGQATSMNSTRVKKACDGNGLKFLKAQYSDDLGPKGAQVREMRQRLEEVGPYHIMTVSDKGYVNVHEVPEELNEMINLINRVNR
jgi:hypothetical protein